MIRKITYVVVASSLIYTLVKDNLVLWQLEQKMRGVHISIANLQGKARSTPEEK